MRSPLPAFVTAVCRRAAAHSAALALAGVAAVGLAASPALAQCPSPTDACADACAGLWLGDLDNNNAVDGDDIIVFERCFLPGPFGSGGSYCECADFNFDGQIDDTDLNYLNRIVEMAGQDAVKKLPRVQLSELRVRKPFAQNAPAVPESRYIEIRTPVAAASLATTDPPSQIQSPTVNGVIPLNEDVRVFTAGWYYLKVLRAVESANPTQSVRGMIAVVVPLNGMTWVSNPTFTTTRGLGLVIDPSFAGSPFAPVVPPAVAGYVFDISPALLSVPNQDPSLTYTFNAEQSTNVTHLIVFRDPSITNPREIPAVGQRINVPPGLDPTANCDIAWSVPGPDVLPPFDAVVDCVSIVRGLDQDVWGCIYGAGLSFRIGPVGGVGFTYAPPHIYRCRNAGTWTRGVDSISTNSDSPFVRNPTCVTQIQGCGELAPDGSTIDCFEAQAVPGCSDADCCLAVCQVDPSCCSSVWDANCANQAQFTCTQCGLNPSSCFVAHPTPSCGDSACCDLVCNIDPSCCTAQWDDSCAHIALKDCLACGDTQTGECTVVHQLPYCSDAECCTAVCNQDPFCCTTTWDATCVERAAAACSGCGALNTGDCCIIHATPYCADATCCQTICNLDPFCCETSWDLGCTQLALVWCSDLKCACGSGPSCFTSHGTPGCSDDLCCQTVCLHDPFCCLVKWDAACVQVAQDQCSTNPGCTDGTTGLPVFGSCYVPHATAGCDKPGCCSQVCAQPGYEYCCNTQWDLSCVALASEICDQCGDPLAGSCYTDHGTPNCSNSACCDEVCAIDPFCCTDSWDGVCALIAIDNCTPPIAACGSATTRSCFIPGFTAGCRTSPCCANICSRIDPFCCEVRWDAICAKEASYFCPTTFVVAVSSGGCLTPHPTRGCSSLECSRAVCSVQPSCCQTTWDEYCVDIAAAVCVAPGACPSTGDCYAAHTSPGCADATCCAGVCTADPTCCDGAWDTACATLARTMCKAPAGSSRPCPCIGECTEPHSNPGCSNATCCNIVCNADPACCEVEWDSECANYARQFCCGAIGCGSGCNRPCLEAHEEPYCNDPYCCDSVCRADPLCCSYSWDALCVTMALERCGSACGVSTAGNCFIVHDLPGCRDGRCCGKICTLDPLCCTETWDQVCVDLANAPAQAAVCKVTTCGQAAAGNCCEPHDTQACNSTPCCTAVCLSDPYCCETEWDANCVDIARTTPSCNCTYECGDDCAGDCCRAHAGNSCDDAECCKIVCAQDSYCCEVEWDTVCASLARSNCTGKNDACPVPPCGSSLLPSCCVPGVLPNCSKLSCCNAICAVDSFCCEVQWDTACAERAQSPEFKTMCGCEVGGCGDPANGSCYQEHDDPFCDDAGCCLTVCAFDALCCTVEWDANCVGLAEFFCGGDFAALVESFDGGAATARPARVPPAGWVPPRLRAAPKPKIDYPPAAAAPRGALPAAGKKKG